ncbi:hypothetical protein GF352_04575 [archaeon]|nr:hypothetical protein [archaeon]
MVEVSFYVEVINAILLIGGSLLLLFWREGSSKNNKLIRDIGLVILLIGFYKLISVAFQIIQFSEYIFAISSIPALIGLVKLMFDLINYLEAKK